MPYDALGNYIPGDDEPSLDQMRLALTKAPSQQQRPLDSVTDTFKRLATEFNPLMMGRTLLDAPKVMYNTTIAPVASAWTGVLQNAQAAGAAKAYGALGMPQEAAEAQSRVQPVTTQGLQAPLNSAAGQQTQDTIGDAFNALHLPALGPGSGVPGFPRVSPRPFITPNDVRVMGARATHAVREAGQIPTDIANVRGAGIQRMSPLTGQPSVGSRMGTAIEGTSQAAGRVGDVARDVGQSTADYMQMRRDIGLSPVPGLPPAMFPDMRMYAMRPKDSTLVTPSVPPTKDVTTLDIGTAPYAAVRDVSAHKPELRASDALAYLAGMDLDVPRTDTPGFAPIVSTRSDEFRAFVQAKAEELYPNAPSPSDALLAFDEQFSRQTDRDAARIKLYDEFRESPEGKAVDMGDLPSSTELQERHVAASQWLNSTLINYVRRKFGAEGDPLVQQASQGFTMLPADDVRRMSESVNEDVLKRRRAQAGMPVAGTLAPAIRDKSVELADATAAVAQLQQRREEYRNIAMQQGLRDPRHLPEYAATTNPLEAAVDKRDKLQDELSNLQLGRDYEKLSDIAVAVDTQPNLLGKIEYPQQQFYPSVTRARPDETLFHVSRNSALQSTGFNELAAQFYDDVMRGNIPIDKLKGLTVEKYVRGKAEGRVAEEKRQAQASAELKTNIESRMQQDMARYVKPENYFGNVGVLELSTSTGFDIDEIRRLISDDTLVLDHCVAEGPTPGSKAKNLWNGRERRYMPLVDPATGQLLPMATRAYTRYIRDAGDPDANQAGMLASVRDKATGLPVATIEFAHASNGKYRIGYASGYQNGNVKKEYHEAIKEYLNSRADVINGSGSDLPNVGLIDLHSAEAVGELQRILGVPRREAEALLDDALTNGALPRFGTRDDLRQVFTVPQTEPVVQQPAAQQPAAQQFATATDLYNYLRDVAQAVGHDESHAMLHVLRQVRQSFDGAPAYEDLLREQPTAFAERITELAQEQGNAIVEQELLALADRIAPLVPPAAQLNPLGAWPLAREMPAAQQPAVQSQAAGAVAEQFETQLHEAQPTPQQQAIINNIREADLADVVNFVEPNRWPLITARTDQAVARVQTTWPADWQDVLLAEASQMAEAIRNGQMPDITNGLDVIERELVAREVQQRIDDIAGRQRPIAAQPVDQFDRVPFDDAIGNFHNAMIELADEEGTWRNSIAEVDRILDDLAHGAGSIYGLWEGDEPLTDREREYLAEQLRALRQEYEAHVAAGEWEPDANHPANRPANQPAVPLTRAAAAPFRPIPGNHDAMTRTELLARVDPADAGEVSSVYDDIVREHPTADALDAVGHLVRNFPMSLWENMSNAQRALLYHFLNAAADSRRANEGRQPPPARGFQEGGSVRYPNFIDAQNVAIQRSQQMNPRVDETDTEADAARHMLASGYMAKSFNPTIAKGLGWLHEAKEAPFRTIGHALGLSNPRYDYEMDMHNNALGIELSKKAKDRADFERMVQESLKQSATTTTPGRPRVMTQKQAIEGTAALKYANGGTVPQPQSLDAMKYELMMRSK